MTDRLSQRKALALICTGVFLASLDQTSVVTALPAIMFDLDIVVSRLDDVSWVLTVYLLAFSLSLPIMGRVGDLYGHRKVFLASLGLFAVGSILVAVSPSLWGIVVSRLIQAVGGGGLIPSGMVLGSHSDMGVKNKLSKPLVLGLIAGAAEIGIVLGPLYGGVVIELLGWRAIFWSNVIPLAGLLIVARHLKETSKSRERFDVIGAVLLSLGLLLCTIGLSQQGTYSASSLIPYSLLAVSGVILVVFFWIESQIVHPILHRRFLISGAYLVAFLTQFLLGGSLVMVLLTVPVMGNTVLGMTPVGSALLLLRFTIAIPVGAVLGGYIMKFLPMRVPSALGLLLVATSLFFMSAWGIGSQTFIQTLHLVLGGLGFGLVTVPLISLAISVGKGAYEGTAVALITLARMFGMTIGLATISAWGMNQFRTLTEAIVFPMPVVGEDVSEFKVRVLSYQAGVTEASLELFSSFFLVGSILSLVAIIPALLLPGWSAGPTRGGIPRQSKKRSSDSGH